VPALRIDVAFREPRKLVLSEDDERVLRVVETSERAGELALVASAVGIGCRVRRGETGWELVVADADTAPAAAALAAFEAETASLESAPAAPDETQGPARDVGGRLAAPILVAVLIGSYWLTGPRAAAGPAFRAGTADAARILDGEWWRTVTALTLHSDASHLVSNVVAGGLLAIAVCRSLGAGVGGWLLLIAGAGGNALNALLHGAPHRSVGASTAVLGAVGVLCGVAAARAWRRRSAGARLWLPVATGLALLAMLGADERTDLGAHLLGFGVGLMAAALTALVVPRPPGRAVQVPLALAALATLGGAWWLALARVSQ
jgi:membrane associated rhomboid family serine protease